MAFLHGVETIVKTVGGVPVTVVRSAVVGLVGIAPKGPNGSTLTLISSPQEAVDTFGSELTGFSIPQALKAVFNQGSGVAIVVNVYDETTHSTDVTAETQVVAAGKAKTAFEPVGTTFTVTNSGGTTTYVLGTDYSRDDFGNIIVLNPTSIANGASIKVTYKKLNVAAVTAAHIIGTAGSAPTGIETLALANAKYGFDAKILIAPTHLGLTGVCEALLVAANKYRAVTIFDAPTATSYATAIAGRGSSGTINGWKTGDKRAILAWPNWKVVNAGTGVTEVRPASQYLAGVICAVDTNEGYWNSPSNHQVLGVVEPEVLVTFALNDQNCQANLLNAAGITTAINAGGFRTWGNRSAAYPTSTAPEQFIPVLRTSDTIDVSVELAMLQYIDKPLNQALLDAVRATVNGFLNTLAGRGAIIDGKCLYIPAKNPALELAAGHVVFDIDYMPPVPGERITFDRFINIAYLANLV